MVRCVNMLYPPLLSTIEREAYAALVALRKYRNWIFGSRVTVHSDHNPLLCITESAPKSAKLMRWSLSLAEFEVTFKYRAGKSNVAADFLSRLKKLRQLALHNRIKLPWLNNKWDDNLNWSLGACTTHGRQRSVNASLHCSLNPNPSHFKTENIWSVNTDRKDPRTFYSVAIFILHESIIIIVYYLASCSF